MQGTYILGVSKLTIYIKKDYFWQGGIVHCVLTVKEANQATDLEFKEKNQLKKPTKWVTIGKHGY